MPSMDESMDYENVVTTLAQELGLLEEDGTLITLDSFRVVEMVMLLEKRTKIPIPSEAIDVARFRTIATIADLLRERAGR